MKISAKSSITSIFFLTCLLMVTAGNSFSEEYASLKGLESAKAVFDFEKGNPRIALMHLQVIDQTFKDQSIQKLKKKPEVVVVFIGPSVKLVSSNQSGFSAEEQKVLEKIAGTVSKMARDGIKFEICLVASKNFGVDPATILPEIKQVGNGWISLIGYESRGYALIPLSP